jgi:hypothetical protein
MLNEITYFFSYIIFMINYYYLFDNFYKKQNINIYQNKQ